MKGFWHSFVLMNMEGLKCFEFKTEYRINCADIVNIGRGRKVGRYFGFEIDFEDKDLSNSHFEKEVNHKFSLFVYPFLSKSAAKCEMREIKDFLGRIVMKKRKEEKDRKEKERREKMEKTK